MICSSLNSCEPPLSIRFTLPRHHGYFIIVSKLCQIKAAWVIITIIQIIINFLSGGQLVNAVQVPESESGEASVFCHQPPRPRQVSCFKRFCKEFLATLGANFVGMQPMFFVFFLSRDTLAIGIVTVLPHRCTAQHSCFDFTRFLDMKLKRREYKD